MFSNPDRSSRPTRSVAAAAGLTGAAIAFSGALAALPAPALAQDATDTATVVLDKTYEPTDPGPSPGEAITFTITLTNHSNTEATGLQVDGPLPDELTDGSWTCTAAGAGSACGAETGTGGLRDTADVGAEGGIVTYLLSSTVLTDDEFTHAVELTTEPGQACEPPATDEDASSGGGYYAPPEAMTCLVNNTLTPQAQTPPTTPDQTSTPQPESLPVTGPSGITMLVALGAAAVAIGAVLFGSARRHRR